MYVIEKMNRYCFVERSQPFRSERIAKFVAWFYGFVPELHGWHVRVIPLAQWEMECQEAKEFYDRMNEMNHSRELSERRMQQRLKEYLTYGDPNR